MNKILYGLLAGVVIGIFIAPDKGAETLKRVRNRLDDYKDQAMDEAEDLVGKGRSMVKKGRGKISKALD